MKFIKKKIKQIIFIKNIQTINIQNHHISEIILKLDINQVIPIKIIWKLKSQKKNLSKIKKKLTLTLYHQESNQSKEKLQEIQPILIT